MCILLHSGVANQDRSLTTKTTTMSTMKTMTRTKKKKMVKVRKRRRSSCIRPANERRQTTPPRRLSPRPPKTTIPKRLQWTTVCLIQG